MTTADAPNDGGCDRQCRTCAKMWKLLGESPEAKRLAGWPMVAMAFATFLLPLMLAIAGAYVLPTVWPHEAAGAVGALAGLAVGVVGAVLLVGLVRRATANRQ